jgi:hypothetical protein
LSNKSHKMKHKAANDYFISFLKILLILSKQICLMLPINKAQVSIKDFNDHPSLYMFYQIQFSHKQKQ